MICWYIDSTCITSPHTEEALGVADCFRQGVDLFWGVVDVERGARACGHAQGPVQRRGAVMVGAHRDAELIEDLADVVRVHAGYVEGDRAAPVLGGQRAED